MNERLRAEEHLRVIRSLMERATVYRAISAPTALVGGLSALALTIWTLWRSGYLGAEGDRELAVTAREFILPWLVPLVLTCAANTLFIWREAQRDQRAFVSAGLRLALRSILPNFFVAAAITFVIWRNPADLEGPTVLGLSWIAFYGLALLSTMNFAPRSLIILGASFVFIDVIWLLLLSSPTMELDNLRGARGATLAMGLTFGLFHLIYAICTWRPVRAAEAETLTRE